MAKITMPTITTLISHQLSPSPNPGPLEANPNDPRLH
jgi:hypothetical protein